MKNNRVVLCISLAVIVLGLAGCKDSNDDDCLSRIKDILTQEKKFAKEPGRRVVNLGEPIKPNTNVTRHGMVGGVSIAVTDIAASKHAHYNLGYANKEKSIKMTSESMVSYASLSKTICTSYFLTLMEENKISLDTPVNEVLKKYGSPVQLTSDINPEWADDVLLRHLLNHSGVDMSPWPKLPKDLFQNLGYESVKWSNTPGKFAKQLEMYQKNAKGKMKALFDPTGSTFDVLLKFPVPPHVNFDAWKIRREPGVKWSYSAGGVYTMQLICELITGKSVNDFLPDFAKKMGLNSFSPDSALHDSASNKLAVPYWPDGTSTYPDGSQGFSPTFPGDCMGTAPGYLNFVSNLYRAYKDPNTTGPISHHVASTMFTPSIKANDFAHEAACLSICQAGDNKLAMKRGSNPGVSTQFVMVLEGPDAGRGITLVANSNLTAEEKTTIDDGKIETDKTRQEAEIIAVVAEAHGWKSTTEQLRTCIYNST